MGIVLKSLIGAFKSVSQRHILAPYAGKEPYTGRGFAVRGGPGLGREGGSLFYQEDGHEYQIFAEVGMDGGYFFKVEEMGTLNLALQIEPIEQKLRIARNILRAFQAQEIGCQILYDHHPVELEKAVLGEPE